MASRNKKQTRKSVSHGRTKKQSAKRKSRRASRRSMRGGVGVLSRVKRASLYSGEGTAAGALAGFALGHYIPFNYTVKHLNEGLELLKLQSDQSTATNRRSILIGLASFYKMFQDNNEAETVLKNYDLERKVETELDPHKQILKFTVSKFKNVSKEEFVSLINRFKSTVIIGAIGGTGGLVYGSVKNSETSTAAKIVRAIIYGMAATLPGGLVGYRAGNKTGYLAGTKGAILGATVAGTLGAMAGAKID